LLTPDALVAILTHVAQDARLRDPFQAALPVAGRDGTLAQRLKGTPAEGNVRAKTGSLANARAISGYVQSANAEPLVFSIIVNNFGVASEAVEKTMDAIIVSLARFSRR
jgi:D-alanyl-D-alanine carboxypeptidase/D-alanyl-D-alanine-endopeptidase (penicillin-binding protein 4)